VQGEEQLGFMLVGHGVPYQLLQDHVDCAWGVLNDNGTGGENLVDGEIVECNFHNSTGLLNFNE